MSGGRSRKKEKPEGGIYISAAKSAEYRQSSEAIWKEEKSMKKNVRLVVAGSEGPWGLKEGRIAFIRPGSFRYQGGGKLGLGVLRGGGRRAAGTRSDLTGEKAWKGGWHKIPRRGGKEALSAPIFLGACRFGGTLNVMGDLKK